MPFERFDENHELQRINIAFIYNRCSSQSGCPEPDIPANGRVNTTNGMAVGQAIYYSCIEGMGLVGQTKRICEAASVEQHGTTCLIHTNSGI
ncbi:hypothetical protein DPMN_150739 [Dreissena polymorpha]|uniref:Sushi domain-containing protein n=1 Tax=Dreissena polymorpha TaxID=45954 RepID=A0A9D4J5V9_DREPO|nr:hypothetical protein DPMN_150739 [Dreissena polymorpha]